MDKLTLFFESIHTEATRKSYKFSIGKFFKWSGKDFESILFLTKPELTDLFCDYALHLKKRVSPNSIAYYFSGIYKYLDINDKEYNKKKIQFLFGEKIERGGDRAITNKELNEMLRVCSSHRDRALLNVFSACGSRPQAICDLKLRDVEEIGIGCLSFRIYAGSTHARFVYVPEFVSDSLKKYHAWRKSKGEKLTSDSWVFIGNRKFASMPIEQMSPSTMAKVFTLLMKKGGITRVKTGNRYDLASCGGFRKRCITIMKRNPNISRAIVEYLFDHKSGLDSHYLKPTREEAFEEYEKAIPDLVFDEAEKLKLDNELKGKKIQELETDKKRITELEANFKHIQDLLERKSSS